jgi:TonB family protein
LICETAYIQLKVLLPAADKNSEVKMNFRTLLCCLLIGCAPSLFAQAPKKVTRAVAMSLIVNRTPPEYPSVAKQLRIEGEVELEISLSEDATVGQVAIVSGNPLLTRPAADAVKHWKFTPYKEDGKPLKAILPVSLTFRLGGAS